MIVRHFRTSDQASWRVWAVRPAGILTERRLHGERRMTPSDQAVDPPLLERRRGDDRRRPRSSLRARGSHVLPQQWQDGWLVFESETPDIGGPASQVRRLAPIPAEWETATDETLAGYLDRALSAERRTA
jgi:hypothetical protein